MKVIFVFKAINKLKKNLELIVQFVISRAKTIKLKLNPKGFFNSSLT